MRLKKLSNFQELLVYERVKAYAGQYPFTQDDGLLEDIACIALNSLKPRYVRHLANLKRHMTDDQRRTYETEAEAAVRAAFEYVLYERSREVENPDLPGGALQRR
jgi:hypothetical protein